MTNGSEFDPKRARSKRPCPLWVDAFQRDTQHLEADEVGAYMLILMAMWTRVDCDFPDDDRRLAKVSRVSTRLWKSRIGPVLRDFFKSQNGSLISERLRKEATYTERQVTLQSNRKSGQKTDKPLKNNNARPSADSSMDTSADASMDHPTQQPNNLHCTGDDDSARDHVEPPPETNLDLTELEQLRIAMGADRSGLTGPSGKILGSMADKATFDQWRQELGLTFEEILGVVREVMAKKRDGPPHSFRYFNDAMQRHAGQKNQPALKPIEGSAHEPDHENRSAGRRKAFSPSGRAHSELIGAFAGAVSDIADGSGRDAPDA